MIEAEREPNFTGTKMIKNITHYQTYIYCKNIACGKRTKVFALAGHKTVRCPSCGTKHGKRDASPKGFPHQDEFGNYFKADRLWVENRRTHREFCKSPLH